MYNQGISREGDALDLGVSMGVVDKRGSYFTYQDIRLGQGRENVKTYLVEHPEVLERLEGEIRTRAGLNVHTFTPADAAKVVPFAGREEDYDQEDASDLAA